MILDLTLKITPQIMKEAQENLKKALAGHLGTHFDVMNKTFPLSYTERNGIVFDISHIHGRDVEVTDIDLQQVKADMFVAFYSGYIDTVSYGTKEYFTVHPQLSDALIDALLERQISIIGVDFSGVRMGKEHTAKDQYCADRGVFIVENLCNLKELVGKESVKISTYPMNYTHYTGLPCRVVARY